MASHPHQHIDGKSYTRTFKTGRRKLSPEFKKVQQPLCLSRQMRQEAKNWRKRFGVSFSEWVEMKMEEKLYN